MEQVFMLYPDYQFRMCSEILEARRRATCRRHRFTKRLAYLASMLSKRRRRRHGSFRSLNPIAEKMARYVNKKDRDDGKLLDRVMKRYMGEVKVALQKLKDAGDKVDVIYARIAKTKKFKMWFAASKLFMRKVRATLEPVTSWTHSDEVVSELKLRLRQMARYQTTASGRWLQGEVQEMLRDVMERMFWT